VLASVSATDAATDAAEDTLTLSASSAAAPAPAPREDTTAAEESCVIQHDPDKVDTFYGDASNIAWRRQELALSASTDEAAEEEGALTVSAVGIDFDALFVFVRFRLLGDYALSQVENACSLVANESGRDARTVAHPESELLLLENRPGDIAGCLRFDVSALF
jgi:hypothetical protein